MAPKPNIVQDSGGVGQNPADGNRPPDSGRADRGNGCKRIGQGHTRAKRNDRECDGHCGLSESAVQPVEQEEAADTAVEGTDGMQAAHSFRDNGGFVRADKDKHKRFGQKPEQQRGKRAVGEDGHYRIADSPADSFFLARSGILGDKGGKGVRVFLCRHIGEGINFHGCGKGGHNGGSEAVYKSLHDKNPKIHYGLLQAGQDGIIRDFPQRGFFQLKMGERFADRCACQEDVKPDSKPREILRNQRRGCGAGRALTENGDKQDVQDNIDDGGKA